MAEIGNTIDLSLDALDRASHARLVGWKGALQSLNEKLLALEKVVLYVAVAVMCACVFAQWFLRAFFTVGYIWLGDLSKYSMLWAGFMGASIATSYLEHFRIDLIRLVKEPRKKKALRILSYMVGFVACTVFGYACFLYLRVLFRMGERSTYYGYPIWPFYTVVMYFYVVSALRFFFTFVITAFHSKHRG